MCSIPPAPAPAPPRCLGFTADPLCCPPPRTKAVCNWNSDARGFDEGAGEATRMTARTSARTCFLFVSVCVCVCVCVFKDGVAVHIKNKAKTFTSSSWYSITDTNNKRHDT